MPGTDARRRVATIALFLFLAAAPAARAATGDLILVSRAAGASGVSGNGGSSLPVGRPGRPPGRLPVLGQEPDAGQPADRDRRGLRAQRRRATITLASRADGAAGAPANAGVSDVAMSDNGRYVVFHTRATNLGPTDTGVDRVFLRDTVANTTTLVGVGLTPTISGDGSTVA